MTKIETITYEYEHCGECPWVLARFDSDKHWCEKEERIIPDLWGDIPDWCPLETKEVKNAKV